MTLYEILFVLWRRKLPLAILAILGIVSGLAVARQVPPTYVADGVLLVSPEPSWAKDILSLPADWVVATERDIIGSRALIADALARIEVPATLELDTLASIREQVSGGLLHPGEETKGNATVSPKLITRIRKGLEIRFEDKSLALSIRQRSRDPNFSADFVNALMQGYLDVENARLAAEKARVQHAYMVQRTKVRKEIARETELQASLVAEANAEARFDHVGQRLEGLESLYEALSADYERISSTPMNSASSVISAAVVPIHPEGSKKLLILAGALIMTFGFGMLAFIASAVRSRARRTRFGNYPVDVPNVVRQPDNSPRFNPSR